MTYTHKVGRSAQNNAELEPTQAAPAPEQNRSNKNAPMIGDSGAKKPQKPRKYFFPPALAVLMLLSASHCEDSKMQC